MIMMNVWVAALLRNEEYMITFNDKNTDSSVNQYRITFPTILTLLRIILIPCIVISLLNSLWKTAGIFFGASIVSDVLDGFIARRYNQQTVLGAILDPFADKCLMIALFATFAWMGYIPWWFVVIVIFKEWVLIAGAVFLFISSYRLTIAPSWLGKGAMGVQALFGGTIFLNHWFAGNMSHNYNFFALVVIAVVLCALIDYMYKVYSSVKKHNEEKGT